MILEVRPNPKDPLGVEFFAAGKRIDNIWADRIYNDRGKLTVSAIIKYDPDKEVRHRSKQEVGEGEV